LRSVRGRQSTPVNRVDGPAQEPSTVDSKEPLDEKLGTEDGGPARENADAAQTDGQNEKYEKIAPSDTKAESPAVDNASPIVNSTRLRDQPLPPLPVAEDRGEHNESDNLQSNRPSITVQVQAPTPISSQHDSPSTSIDTNTPTASNRDEDGDTEMAEAPAPPVDHVSQDLKQPRGALPIKTDVPPTPSHANTQLPRAPVPPTLENSVVPTPNNERQQWLLPPIRAEHKGRKCLVLDLDETLVHSSFKVQLPSAITKDITHH
jgi:RNA polymerase II subunit A small phosphatase-like protein